MTTREIAEAAGVAEGTLFRIFATKQALMMALIGHVTDPEPLIDDLQTIDLAEPLVERVRRILDVLGDHHLRLRRVFGAVHSLAHEKPTKAEQKRRDAAHAVREAQLAHAIETILAPDGDHLRTTEAEAAAAIRSMSVMMGFPPSMLPDTLTTARVADILVHGIAPASTSSMIISTEDH